MAESYIMPSGTAANNVVIFRSDGTTLYYAYYKNGNLEESGSKYYTDATDPTDIHGVSFYMANPYWTVKATKACKAMSNTTQTQSAEIKRYTSGEQIAAWRYTDGPNQVTAFV